ncbi:hypothetical protein Bpfe_004982 [Biomphalaria pfeifferi]|uniref:Uncharacterized protein n=1 Tax=Biomphalaria pfeifferi TaxID=112525 RepID=A0AAD8C302_BIOPF|nr:hypothetical protein Bpfe_004982 [Biomphalaria pfeifferi]
MNNSYTRRLIKHSFNGDHETQLSECGEANLHKYLMDCKKNPDIIKLNELMNIKQKCSTSTSLARFELWDKLSNFHPVSLLDALIDLCSSFKATCYVLAVYKMASDQLTLVT